MDNTLPKLASIITNLSASNPEQEPILHKVWFLVTTTPDLLEPASEAVVADEALDRLITAEMNDICLETFGYSIKSLHSSKPLTEQQKAAVRTMIVEWNLQPEIWDLEAKMRPVDIATVFGLSQVYVNKVISLARQKGDKA